MTEPVRRERFTCRVCAEQGECDIFALTEMMYGSREIFDYASCKACGCLQIHQIPVDLSRHYPYDYYSQQPRIERKSPRGLKGYLMRWYCRSAALRPDAVLDGAIRERLPMPTDFAEFGHYLLEGRLRSAKDRILDVGCGASPYLLAAMRRCGFGSVEGIDPFIAADSVYESVPVLRRTIDQVQGQYGLVMFNHSLEHVPDPVATLNEAARLLHQGGTCLVRIPVMGTYFWRRFGENWVELDPPRHLHMFGVKSMYLLAQRTGFRIRKIVFDSTSWEITASVRFERGISLRGTVKLDDGFSAEELRGFAKKVGELNKLNDAGRACFYLERC